MAVTSHRTYVAMRLDGLGERLRALVNAIALAELTDGQFAFDWRQMPGTELEFHDIMAAEEMFDATFLQEHYRPELGTEVLPIQSKADEILGRLPGKGEFVRVDQNVFDVELKGARELFNLRGAFARAFAKIRFTPELEDARRLAAAVELPPLIPALHLRAGDVVYGRHRFSGRFTLKLYPFPLGIRVVEDAIGAGTRPIVFAQDAEFRAWLRDTFDIYESTDFLGGINLSRSQTALFEICLMARCSSIHAGNSGFALLAALLSDQRVVQPSSFLTPQERLRVIDECLAAGPQDARITDLQRATAAWASIKLSGDLLPLEGQLRRSDLALRFDKLNPLYALHSASVLFELGRNEEAEQRLADQLHDGTEARQVFVENMRLGPYMGAVLASPYLSVFSAAARRGLPLAAFCIGLASKASGVQQEADEYGLAFRNLRSPRFENLYQMVVPRPGILTSDDASLMDRQEIVILNFREQLSDKEKENQQLRGELTKFLNLREELSKRKEDNRQLRGELAKLLNVREKLSERDKENRQLRGELSRRLHKLYRSHSWRLTAPLRWITHRLRRLTKNRSPRP